jgi:hypothetical protein
MFTVEELIKKSENSQNAAVSIKIRKSPELLNQLIELTSFLDCIDPPINIRMKYIKLGIKEIQRCKNCFLPIRTINIENGFCSSKSCPPSYYNKNKTEEQIEKKAKCISDTYHKKSEIEKINIKSNRKKSMTEKYGVGHNFLIPEVKNKIREGNIIKYGDPIVTKNRDVIEKIKKTNLEKYGGNSPMCNEKVKEKSRESTFERFGSLYPPFKTYKEYCMPSGKVVKYLGYENRAYAKLLTEMIEEDFLIAGSDLNKILKPIEYLDPDLKKCLYYPDIFIPKCNKIIEVKSNWTYEINKEINTIKGKACLALGYDFEFWIYVGKNEKNIIPKIIKMSKI